MIWVVIGTVVVLVMVWSTVTTKSDESRERQQEQALGERYLATLAKAPPLPEELLRPPPRNIKVPASVPPETGAWRGRLVNNGVAVRGVIIHAGLDLDEDGHGSMEFRYVFRKPGGEVCVRNDSTGSKAGYDWCKSRCPVAVIIDPVSDAAVVYENVMGINSPRKAGVGTQVDDARQTAGEERPVEELPAAAVPTSPGTTGQDTGAWTPVQGRLPQRRLGWRAVRLRPRSNHRGFIMEAGTQGVLGRAPDCQMVLTVDTMSRRHVQFKHDGEFLHYRDLRSPSGLFLNGEHRNEWTLVPGDVLQVGGIQLLVEEVDRSAVLQ